MGPMGSQSSPFPCTPLVCSRSGVATLRTAVHLLLLVAAYLMFVRQINDDDDEERKRKKTDFCTRGPVVAAYQLPGRRGRSISVGERWKRDVRATANVDDNVLMWRSPPPLVIPRRTFVRCRPLVYHRRARAPNPRGRCGLAPPPRRKTCGGDAHIFAPARAFNDRDKRNGKKRSHTEAHKLSASVVQSDVSRHLDLFRQ